MNIFKGILNWFDRSGLSGNEESDYFQDNYIKEYIENLDKDNFKTISGVSKSILIQNLSNNDIERYFEWKLSLKSEKRGDKLMYNVKGYYKWLDDNELFDYWLNKFLK
jgi:hypothetical protein